MSSVDYERNKVYGIIIIFQKKLSPFCLKVITIILAALNGDFHPMDVLKINSPIKKGVQN